MREKDHLFGINAGLHKDIPEHVDHALCDATRIGVRGQHGESPDHFVGRIVDQNRLGERTTDVNTNAIGAARRRRFRHRLRSSSIAGSPASGSKSTN